MADEEVHERDNNDFPESSRAEEDVYLESESGDFALQRLIMTTAGQDLYVSSIAQSALGMGNWGGLLGAAPDALGRLGQCFVLASDPLAATLTIPEKAGLPYKSLRANLVECSDKGRTTFRDAESKIKKVSGLALAVCEPGGIIDLILEAVEDDDLAELDLPEQLATLKRISISCIKDTTELKMKVDDWGKFAKSIHKACVDEDQDLGNKEKGLGDQIEVKELSVKLKHAAVDESKNQTAEYRRQLATRQESHDKAEKANSRGALVDFALTVGDTALHMAKSYLNPLSAINLTFGSRQPDTENNYHPGSHASHVEEDPGVILAEALLPIFHRVAELLTLGPDENAGVDWERLTGHFDRSSDINSILSGLRDALNRFVSQQSAPIRQIRAASKPGEKAILEIQNVAKKERDLGSNLQMTLTEQAPIWRKQVSGAESDIADLLSNLLETARKAETERKEEQNKGRKTKMSRAEIRFEQFRMAQQALFDAEGRLNKRLEEDLKMTEEFNAMQLELQRLLTSKATMTQVKEIVGECVSHLHYFCEKLDELATFFAMLQSYIEEMDSTRVNPFSTMASTTKHLSDRAEAETSEEKRKKKELVKQKKLNDLKLRALELKGYYLVAKAMADTYTEVSASYIIPGVNRIERLSLPGAKNLTKEERAAKISEVGILATNAKTEVKRIANQRKKEMIRAMADNRGEVNEQQAIESG